MIQETETLYSVLWKLLVYNEVMTCHLNLNVFHSRFELRMAFFLAFALINLVCALL